MSSACERKGASAWTTTATRFLDSVAALARAVRSGLAPADPHASAADKAASAKMRMFVYGGMGAAARPQTQASNIGCSGTWVYSCMTC